MKANNQRAAAAAMVLAILLSGCSLFNSEAAPRDKYIDTQEAFILVLGSVVDAKRSGLIEQGHYDEVVVPLIVEGNKLLDDMGSMVRAGAYDQVELLRQSLLSIVARLQLERGA